MRNFQTFKDAAALGAAFTQLLHNEKPFGNQNEKFYYHLGKYTYIAELFTNVKLRAKDIPDYVKTLSDTFRKIINSDVRYRQRQDDLPAALGCRAFGVQHLGGGWYSPNIKVASSSAQVLEYICHQWCKRTSQYPHTLQADFDRVSSAKYAMPKTDYSYDYYKGANLSTTRYGHIIKEEYYLSMPYRLQNFAECYGFRCLSFGAACRILLTEQCAFGSLYDNLNQEAAPHKFYINDCFAVQGMRAVQTWGHLNKNGKPFKRNKNAHYIDNDKNDIKIKKTRKFYGTNTDRLAALYYRACKLGLVTFNAYVYGRMKTGNYKYW